MSNDEQQNLNQTHTLKMVQKFQTLSAKKYGLRRKQSLPNHSTFQLLWRQCSDYALGLFLLAFVSSLIFLFVSVKLCPASHSRFLPFRSQCYQMHNESLTWSEAQAYCQSGGGFLLELYTPTEQDYVKKLLIFSGMRNKYSLWLGASDHQNTKVFKWNMTAREPAFNMPWAPHFPSKTSSSISCVLMLHNLEQWWINTDCQENLHFICKTMLFDEMRNERPEKEVNMTVITESPSKVDIEPWAQEAFTGQTDLVLHWGLAAMSWSQSRSLCKSHGMDLVILDTDAKFKYVASQVYQMSQSIQNPSSRLWYGAIRNASGSSQYEFQWVNGVRHNLRHNSWQIDEDSKWETKCLYSFVKQWVDKPLFYMTDCNETLFFDHVICEKSPQKHVCSNDEDCHHRATCLYRECHCSSGFAGDGYYCFDINECHQYMAKAPIVIHNCGNDYCTNTLGSHNCSLCDYKLEPIRSPPTMINGKEIYHHACKKKERFCDKDKNNCASIYRADCLDLATSYTCKCRSPFRSLGIFCSIQAAIVSSSVYSLNLMRGNWDQARAICLMEGLDLAMFKSLFHWNMVRNSINNVKNGVYGPNGRKDKNFLTNDLWLGGKSNKTGYMTWARTERRIEGFDHYPDERCLSATLVETTFDRHLCSYEESSICEIQVKAAACKTNAECGHNATCVPDNLEEKNGECECNMGFYGNGLVCEDVDECEQRLDGCNLNAICHNNQGSYRCECKEGYIGDGKQNCFETLEGKFNKTYMYLFIVDRVKSCFEAQENCEANGSELAAFETDEEWKFIVDQTPRHFK